ARVGGGVVGHQGGGVCDPRITHVPEGGAGQVPTAGTRWVRVVWSRRGAWLVNNHAWSGHRSTSGDGWRSHRSPGGGPSAASCVAPHVGMVQARSTVPSGPVVYVNGCPLRVGRGRGVRP